MLRLTPTKRLAVVCSSSAFEGNAVEIVRWLIANYPGRIVWLLSRGQLTPADAERLLGAPSAGGTLEIRAKRSLKSFFLFARAEVAFVTTVVYGGPPPGRRRLFVNVWHGDGPKTTVPDKLNLTLPAHITVAGTAAWGAEKARAFGNRVEDVLLCGNPRIDQYERPASDEALRALRLDPSRRLFLWAPTFRQVRQDVAGSKWADSDTIFAFRELASAADALEALSTRLGIQIAVKPHPLDAASFELPGTVTFTDEDLLRAGLGFYQLIARADALITDYSSVWTDFIVLDRPIAFFCPDLEEYAAGRGFFPNFMEHLPGPLLRDHVELFGYLEAAASTPAIGAEHRQAAVEGLGIVTETGATERLMTDVAQRLGWPSAAHPAGRL